MYGTVAGEKGSTDVRCVKTPFNPVRPAANLHILHPTLNILRGHIPVGIPRRCIDFVTFIVHRRHSAEIRPQWLLHFCRNPSANWS